jgi:hypothetical protein
LSTCNGLCITTSFEVTLSDWLRPEPSVMPRAFDSFHAFYSFRPLRSVYAFHPFCTMDLFWPFRTGHFYPVLPAVLTPVFAANVILIVVVPVAVIAPSFTSIVVIPPVVIALVNVMPVLLLRSVLLVVVSVVRSVRVMGKGSERKKHDGSHG